jgi:D-3-phosphoglycerate dehydrogenase / 2-oxoglutarate reductase
LPVNRLRGRALGLIGYGHIGSQVARRALGFGLTVAAYDPYVPRERLEADGTHSTESLESLLARSDFVSVHVPLNESTRDLIDSTAISQMKTGAILINTSRGPIVSTEAVIDALREGTLGAACLDVFSAEPPDISAFADVPSLIATPHSAFYSEEAIRESQTKAVEAILDVLAEREPRYRVI